MSLTQYTFANAAIWLTIIRSQMTLYHNVAGYSAIASHFGLKVDLKILIVYRSVKHLRM